MSQNGNLVYVNGVSFPTLTQLTTTWNLRSGISVDFTYVGLRAYINSQVIICQASGASMTAVSNNGDGNWTLKASFPDTTNPATDTHELDVTESQLQVWQNPIARAGCVLPKEVMCAVQLAQKKLTKGDFGFDASSFDAAQTWLAATGTGNANITNSADRTQAQKIMFLTSPNGGWGIDNFIDYSHVYRRTLTGASAVQMVLVNVGVGLIWTSAEVTAYEHIPLGGFFQLPAGMVWLKAAPTSQLVWGLKTQIQYHYVEAKAASGLLYNAYGAASLSADGFWTS